MVGRSARMSMHSVLVLPSRVVAVVSLTRRECSFLFSNANSDVTCYIADIYALILLTFVGIYAPSSHPRCPLILSRWLTLHSDV